MTQPETITFCTRGSPLALAQTNAVVAECRRGFPKVEFRVEIIRTTGDKMQTASTAQASAAGGMVAKGWFTKELETALLEGTADLAVHSLKDLPTELPEGLELLATPPRADVREVLLYRSREFTPVVPVGEMEWRPGSKSRWDGGPGVGLAGLPEGGTVATSSPRRAAQLRAARPDLRVEPIRGNVGTRLQKLATDPQYDALLLAAAGLGRLGWFVAPKSRLTLDPRLPAGHTHAPPPPGLLATVLDEAVILPAVGQGALALEASLKARPLVRTVAAALNHANTFAAVTAERSFLRTMGGGCQSPVAAYARVVGHQLWLRAVSFQDGTAKRGELRLPVAQAVELGVRMAEQLR